MLRFEFLSKRTHGLANLEHLDLVHAANRLQDMGLDQIAEREHDLWRRRGNDQRNVAALLPRRLVPSLSDRPRLESGWRQPENVRGLIDGIDRQIAGIFFAIETE